MWCVAAARTLSRTYEYFTIPHLAAAIPCAASVGAFLEHLSQLGPRHHVPCSAPDASLLLSCLYFNTTPYDDYTSAIYLAKLCSGDRSAVHAEIPTPHQNCGFFLLSTIGTGSDSPGWRSQLVSYLATLTELKFRFNFVSWFTAAPTPYSGIFKPWVLFSAFRDSAVVGLVYKRFNHYYSAYAEDSIFLSLSIGAFGSNLKDTFNHGLHMIHRSKLFHSVRTMLQVYEGQNAEDIVGLTQVAVSYLRHTSNIQPSSSSTYIKSNMHPTYCEVLQSRSNPHVLALGIGFLNIVLFFADYSLRSNIVHFKDTELSATRLKLWPNSFTFKYKIQDLFNTNYRTQLSKVIIQHADLRLNVHSLTSTRSSSRICEVSGIPGTGSNIDYTTYRHPPSGTNPQKKTAGGKRRLIFAMQRVHPLAVGVRVHAPQSGGTFNTQHDVSLSRGWDHIPEKKPPEANAPPALQCSAFSHRCCSTDVKYAMGDYRRDVPYAVRSTTRACVAPDSETLTPRSRLDSPPAPNRLGADACAESALGLGDSHRRFGAGFASRARLAGARNSRERNSGRKSSLRLAGAGFTGRLAAIRVESAREGLCGPGQLDSVRNSSRT
ncbi:hypothetical protein C8R43DRAFT_1119802 [Mycena crocata]|nr:hypothetical protein C8R43DRAFT_1119802 [Mycena crocata]